MIQVLSGFDLDTTGIIDLATSKTGAGAIHLDASANDGGIHLETKNGGSGLINIDAGTGGFDLDMTGIIDLATSKTGAGAIHLDASANDGGIHLETKNGGSGLINIDSGTGGFDLDSTGQVNIASSKNGASAMILMPQREELILQQQMPLLAKILI